jgi:hypothetical protein
MKDRIRAIAIGAAAVVVATFCPPLEAAVCPSVFVPDGYGALCLSPDDADWKLEVTPEPRPLGELSKLTIRPVDEEVEDPFSWLQEQVAIDLNGLRLVVEELLEHPDNPFAALIPEGALDPWLEQFGVLGQLPLRGCGYPFQLARRDVWQIDCRWDLGPVAQIARLQLVDATGEPYLVTIWTAGEQRLRHLQAVANSLEWRA